MTIVNATQLLADWLNANVCKDLKFKKPPKSVDAPVDDDYDYQEINPHAFPMFLPTNDRMPPGIVSSIPSICVQLVDGADDLTAGSRTHNIRLGLSCWNPGIHSLDMYYPEGTRPEEPAQYKSSAGGWMDVWNFVDYTLRKIEMAEDMNGLCLVQSQPITFGPFKDQESIPDYYPHWFAWIEFAIQTENLRINPDIEELL